MSEEKRRTRLLPFSLRREPTGPADGGREGFDKDAELRGLLGAWEAPSPTAGSRERLLASFRSRVARRPLWKRLLTSTVRVPVPVAACAALALALGAYALVSRPAQTHTAAAKTGAGAPSPVVRVVEVPVERVVEVPVERVVYVEKKERGTAAARSPRAKTMLARRDSRSEGGGAGRASEASYVTPLDMAEFQPSDALKMRVIRKGRTDEE
jgi:hypothetical protein